MFEKHRQGAKQKDDVLRQAYYKYAREDGHHPESYWVLKVLHERQIRAIYTRKIKTQTFRINGTFRLK